MTHDELAEDLATHLRGGTGGLVWTDMQMGPSGSPRPDVWVMPLTYSTFRPLSYEVKVSRADFLADVGAGKWQSYMAFSAGVVFACDAGLLKLTDLPQATGLIERGAGGNWKHRRRPATRHVENLPLKVWTKLVFDGVERCRGAATKAFATQWTMQESIKRKLGERVAKILGDTEQAEQLLEHLRDEAGRIRQRNEEDREGAHEEVRRIKHDLFEPEFRMLAAELGIENYQPFHHRMLAEAIRRARNEFRADQRTENLRGRVRALQQQMQGLLEALGAPVEIDG